MNPAIDLPQRIKRYRGQLRESQKTFGARFGVSRLAVRGWEKGAIPNNNHLPLLLEQLTASEARPEEESAYQFDLPFDLPLDIAIKMSPQASQTIHFEVRVRTKVS